MLRFIFLRILTSIPTLIIVSVGVFMIVRLIPGDPAVLMLGDSATPEMLASVRGRMGLDQPITVQYWIWLQNVLQGDLGVSTTTGREVLPVLISRFFVSAPIVIIAIVLATLIAVPLGLYAAWHQDRFGDLAVVTVATVLMAIPSFWLGLIILLIFGLLLQWFPVIGYVSFERDFLGALLYIAMPVATLVLTEIGVLARMTRASTVTISRLDYITHARAKGLSEFQIVRRHVLRNAFAPTWTLLGLILGSLLGGIAITETVFTIPGLGRHLIDAIYGRDYPVVQGCILFITCIYILVNLLVDIVYPLLDPKVTV